MNTVLAPSRAPVLLELRDIYPTFTKLCASRQLFATRGKTSFVEAEEAGYLAAVILDYLEMPVPWAYIGSDRYQIDDAPLPGWVDLEDPNDPGSELWYAGTNTRIILRLRKVARSAEALAQLAEAVREDIEARMWVRVAVGNIAEYATKADSSAEALVVRELSWSGVDMAA